MTRRVRGGCMCGRTRFTVIPVEDEMHACHCEQCRKWSGGVFLAVRYGTSLDVEAGAPVKVFASSDWAERGFCGECGSSLFWRMRDGSETLVALNALEPPDAFTFGSELFIDSKPGTYNFRESTKKLTEAEAIALHGSGTGQS